MGKLYTITIECHDPEQSEKGVEEGTTTHAGGFMNAEAICLGIGHLPKDLQLAILRRLQRMLDVNAL